MALRIRPVAPARPTGKGGLPVAAWPVCCALARGPCTAPWCLRRSPTSSVSRAHRDARHVRLPLRPSLSYTRPRSTHRRLPRLSIAAVLDRSNALQTLCPRRLVRQLMSGREDQVCQYHLLGAQGHAHDPRAGRPPHHVQPRSSRPLHQSSDRRLRTAAGTGDEGCIGPARRSSAWQIGLTFGDDAEICPSESAR